MRWMAFLLLAAGAFACGGQSDVGGDAGDDSGGDSSTFTCNGSPCSGYCIHPSSTTCPTCTALPDGGTCPSGSTLQNDCPAGPAMPIGQYCVTYPPPEAPYCSPTVAPGCPLPTGTSGDVYCMAACGA